ncbi:amino acid ABC transporter substrate-binding protein [Salinibacterium sp. UTAS2018]|uniref:ABC transporter substrate-binding protein n=1 Tax=Salinibacterium sp. UTAS2018 TaxID=2508880 RepID=UPI0010093D9B|nr:ABC transporter substrate-binding protein [Salinibacterium sp. UTAS2018]QAV70198.1 amino acid ABC transporter substrate-binding protein [Salinibacterium sp. UTAS2018]
MTRSRSTRAVVVAAVVACALAACSAPAPSPMPSLPAVASATATPAPQIVRTGDGVLRIGTIFPTSGTFSFLAPAQKAGVAAAVKEVNAAGGVNGEPVEIVAVDSGEAKNTKLESHFATLVSKDVDVVIGPSSSALAQRVIPLALDAQIPVISPAATFSSLDDVFDGGYFFRTIPAYDQQAYALAAALAGGETPKKVALVYVADEQGAALHDTVVTALAEYDSELVADEVFESSTTKFDEIVASLKGAAPDVVVVGSTYDSEKATKAVIEKLIGAGFTGSELWLTSLNTGDYSQAFKNGTLKGVRGVIEGYQPAKSFISTLKATDSALSSYRYAAEAYDATILAVLAAIVAQDDAGAAIAGSLYDVSKNGVKCLSFAECLDVLATTNDIDYDGVSGAVNFTPDGNVEPAFWGYYTYDGENKFEYKSGGVFG